ncbi:probably inactive leucine-rich repeat receptor-like protein kinase [Tanacetum coccineum]
MEKFTRPLRLVELETATNNFDNKNVIGYGNRGLMYKAMFPNGLLLAIKRLHKFESFEKEFVLEIEILGRLRHTNLVPLLGFCHEREKKFLVYKYMCNGTLNQWLHSNSLVEGKKMGWTLRFKIAIGIARGLAWLHHNNVLRVAHLNISSKCILLDDKFDPKISNFGNSGILMNTSGIPSSVRNFVVPDSSPYKEDVYSFGILLLELVTGREPSTWTNSPTDHVCSREFMIDESLMGQGFDEEIHETLKVAEKCIRVQTDGEIYMLQVYQEMHAIGISSNEISVDLCMDMEEN